MQLSPAVRLPVGVLTAVPRVGTRLRVPSEDYSRCPKCGDALMALQAEVVLELKVVFFLLFFMLYPINFMGF